MEFPRTLLLTLWAPDARYKIFRKILDQLPAERLRWCSLWPCRGQADLAVAHRAFTPRQLHWRIENTALGHLYYHEWQSRTIARRIAQWAAPFEPQALWVLPELGAASVGWHLKKQLGLPLHLTLHDAHETAAPIVRAGYMPFYMRSLDRIFSHAESLDAISREMLSYALARYPNLTTENSMAFYPSVPRAWMAPSPERMPMATDTRLRRIGFCGSARVSNDQWAAFLAQLSGLPFRFEILSFCNADAFPQAPLPENVTIMQLPFAPTEKDIIDTFIREGVHACHLGLWKEPDRALFALTSFSAKLATYAAAGIPIILDGPTPSAAWNLVERHGAGILSGDDADASAAALRTLFEDERVWLEKARGALAMCKADLDLESGVERIRTRIANMLTASPD